jgi:hypothetical protein
MRRDISKPQRDACRGGKNDRAHGIFSVCECAVAGCIISNDPNHRIGPVRASSILMEGDEA